MADDKPSEMSRRAFLKGSLSVGSAAVTVAGGAWSYHEWNASKEIDEQAKKALREHDFQGYVDLRQQQKPHDQRLSYAFGMSTFGVTGMVSRIALHAYDSWDGPN